MPSDERALCFIGKRKLTDHEATLLSTLGLGIAAAGYQLYTVLVANGAPANAAVASGYRSLKPKGVHDMRSERPEDAETIVYYDKDIAADLDERVPGWWAKTDWICIPSEEALEQFCVAMLVSIANTDWNDQEVVDSTGDGNQEATDV
jgi:hypothetical protein